MRFRTRHSDARHVVAIVSATAACLVSATWPTGACSETQPRYAKAYWSRVTTDDVEAAYRLLEINHPGAAPSGHDARFQELLREARRRAVVRARTVRDYQGYVATMAGLANSFGDRHVWSHPSYLLRPKWAGVLTAKRAGRWVVVEEAADASAALAGAELEGCDGFGAEAMADSSLARFRVDWRVEAQQEQAAPFLLVNEGNPFVHVPRRCTFTVHGLRRVVDMVWREIGRSDLSARAARASGAGAAGFGVRQVG